MKRSVVAMVVALLLGLVLLGAGVAPSVGCERTYGLELTEDAAGQSVVDAADLPDDALNATERAAAADGPVEMRQTTYATHLDGRAVRHDGTVYGTELVVLESCGGALEDALLVGGVALTTLGGLALPLLVLYRERRPPMNRLHYVAILALVVGASTFAGGIAAPAGCQDNFALETTGLPDANASDEPVVDVETFPPALQNATQKSVDSNRTAFVDRSLYREHLENRNVRYAGSVYDAEIVLVQDCGGGIDDALLVVGAGLATLAAVALSLLVVLDHGHKVL